MTRHFSTTWPRTRIARVGDHVIVMKGPGEGGTVVGYFQGFCVVRIGHWENEVWEYKANRLPFLVEPEALMIDANWPGQLDACQMAPDHEPCSRD